MRALAATLAACLLAGCAQPYRPVMLNPAVYTYYPPPARLPPPQQFPEPLPPPTAMPMEPPMATAPATDEVEDVLLQPMAPQQADTPPAAPEPVRAAAPVKPPPTAVPMMDFRPMRGQTSPQSSTGL